MLFSKPLQITDVKSTGEDWQVEGYVSVFNNVDLGRDVVRPGAFKKTLRNGPKVRFLLHHDPRLVLGVPLKLTEDKKGLFGRFKISKTKLGEETHQLVADGALDSFSFGYEAETYTIDEKENVRYLDELVLYESSLVSMPMNPEAVVTGWKDYLNGVGISEELTLAEKLRAHADGIKTLIAELRGLAGKDRPLNSTKQQELAELLEMFSGMDDVRQTLASLLAPVPSNLVESHRVKSQLAALRKRLPEIISTEE